MKNAPHSKRQRIVAAAVIVLLLIIYAAALISSLIDSPLASSILQCAIFCSIVVPVLLYAALLVFRRLHPQDPDQKEQET